MKVKFLKLIKVDRSVVIREREDLVRRNPGMAIANMVVGFLLSVGLAYFAILSIMIFVGGVVPFSALDFGDNIWTNITNISLITTIAILSLMFCVFAIVQVITISKIFGHAITQKFKDKCSAIVSNRRTIQAVLSVMVATVGVIITMILIKSAILLESGQRPFSFSEDYYMDWAFIIFVGLFALACIATLVIFIVIWFRSGEDNEKEMSDRAQEESIQPKKPMTLGSLVLMETIMVLILLIIIVPLFGNLVSAIISMVEGDSPLLATNVSWLNIIFLVFIASIITGFSAVVINNIRKDIMKYVEETK